MKEIIGGVTAAKGFSAGGIHCGVKKSNIDKKDVALIVSDCMCSAAGIYTKNIVNNKKVGSKANFFYLKIFHSNFNGIISNN